MGTCSKDPVHRGVGLPHPTSPCFLRKDSVTFFNLASETFPATWFPLFQFRHCLPFDPSMLTARAPPRMPPTAVPPLPPVGLPLNAPAPSNYYENGRMYGGFRKGKYMFPNDEVIWGRLELRCGRSGLTWDSAQAEMDRMDIYHKFFLVARREALHSTPFIPNYDNVPRILDLGTGTGIWAIDMAE